MSAWDIVMGYRHKYGEDTAGCASEFLQSVKKGVPSGKKIRRIAVYYPVMSRGGVQRVISLLLPIYHSMGWKVVLITERIADDDYPVPEWVERSLITSEGRALVDEGSFAQRYRELEDIIEAERVDLFLHHGVRQALFVYDVILARAAGVHVVAEKHQVFTQGFCDINDLFWVHLPAFQIIDALVVLSSLEETYWRTLGINAFYIENPLNEGLKIDDQGRTREYISWAGRLDIYSKQYLDVLEIALIVKRTHPEVKFRMFGSGSNAKIRDLKERIERYGLQENVCFCGYETDIAQMYRDTRIQLVTSAYEGFPMVVYESKIAGIPLVMYDLPYLELLKDGLGHICVPNGDVNGIAESICRILDGPDLEARLCREAKESLAGYDNEKVAQKWGVLLRDIEDQAYDGSGKDDRYAMMIRTMHRHYAVAQKKYESLLWDSEGTVLAHHVRKGLRARDKVAICPFGKVGRRVKRMLNEKGIQETYIIDNGMAQDHPEILSMQELKKMDCSKLLFVVCCEDEDLKRWFRDELSSIVDQDSILYHDKALEGEI